MEKEITITTDKELFEALLQGKAVYCEDWPGHEYVYLDADGDLIEEDGIAFPLEIINVHNAVYTATTKPAKTAKTIVALTLSDTYRTVDNHIIKMHAIVDDIFYGCVVNSPLQCFCWNAAGKCLNDESVWDIVAKI